MSQETNVSAKRPPRYLEIIPGAFSLTVITFPIWGSLFIPDIVAYFIILFDVFWLYKSITLGVIATMSYYRLKASKANDWLGEAKQQPDFEKIHHLIIMPTYKEPLETLRTSIGFLERQDFPRERIHVVLGCEERDDEVKEKAGYLAKEFGDKFGHFWATYHPDIEGEVKGKSSNEAFAGKWAKKKLIDELGVDINFVTITSMDADGRFHEKYFSALAYEFLTTKERYRLFFQPVIHFYNNIWRVPAPIRVVSTMSNIWQTGKLSRSERLINTACYSTSLKMMDEVGYWDVDVIPEDYRIFFKCFFQYNGEVRVQPIFLPVSLDAAEGTTYWESLTNQYQQLKRWAWGTSDDPYVFMKYWHNRKMNIVTKTMRVLQLVEEHFFWPINWFIITLGATVPPLVNPRFKTTVLGQNLSTFPRLILSLTLVTLVIILIIDAKQRPPRPAHISRLRRLLMNFEFVLMPLVGFFFSALPGLDAHTRLMLGKYIEYKVTEKVA